MDNNKRILIVDDEPAIREMIEMRAQGLGLLVTMAENGAEALKKLQLEQIDLIICDVLMPVMDGFTFYKEVKKNSSWSNIPVLILTARGKMEDTFKVMGADDFIAKPFDGKILMEKVQQLLQQDRSPIEKLLFPEPHAAPVMASLGKNIFVAATDKEPLEIITTHLQQHGYAVQGALTGRETLFNAPKIVPKVLLLDILMADIESHKIVKMLKAAPELKDLKIVTYCFYRVEDIAGEDIRQMALTMDLASERCFDEGAIEYLGRFNDGLFIQEMQKYLETA